MIKKKNHPPPQVIEVIGRIKLCLAVETDQELAAALGFHQTAISKWKKQGEIPVRTFIKIAKKLGKTTRWLLTGEESRGSQVTGLKEVLADLDQWLDTYTAGAPDAAWGTLLAHLFAQFPFSDRAARDLLMACLGYIKEASLEERETIRRLLAGLRSGGKVRQHLIGQLELIERLVEQEHKGGRDEPAAGRTKAAG